MTGEGPDELQYLFMPLIPNDKCVYPHTIWHPRQITINMLCAGHLKVGKNVCSGDSGGGLIVSKNTKDDTAEVIGIVSFTLRACESRRAPAVFTRVSRYLGWIREKMEGNISCNTSSFELKLSYILICAIFVAQIVFRCKCF